ncbi:MAG TPA: Fic family protein [Acidimicrobiia bacterium]|nr:Fic family protein [Acidimicrobiia bacterium]
MRTAPCGAEVPIVWRGRQARAFVPLPLAERELRLSPATAARAAAASAEVEAGAASLGAGYEGLARLLLRAEGLASSSIEGVLAGVLDVVVAEGAPEAARSPATWVAANLAAVTDALTAAPEPLSVTRLRDWHRTLMAGSPLPGRFVGVVRDEQGWIGGTSPLDAALVTPPPDRLGELLDDLVAYANRRDVDPVAQAAIAHAQFEIIHPFTDGNGRIGRVLVSWLLSRRLALVVPPPVSTGLAADRDGYLAGLSLFRLGQHDRWVSWFAYVAGGAGAAEVALVRAVDELQARWRRRLARPRDGRALRRDALAWRVLDLLPRHLVLTAGLVAQELGGTARAAANALAELVDAGVLEEHPVDVPAVRGRPPRRYVSPELLAVARAGPAP